MRRLFAWAYDRAVAPLEAEIAPRRQALLTQAVGRILEIGPGTGANLAYLSPDADWIGVEPNPHMTAQLLRRHPGRTVLTGSAEALPFEEGTFDTVVATLVFCSVADLARSLSEVRRVLRPGGKLLFLEHLRAPPRTIARTLQSAVYWPWRCLGDGCRTNRETVAAIADRFSKVEAEHYWVSPRAVPLWVAYQAAGLARVS